MYKQLVINVADHETREQLQANLDRAELPWGDVRSMADVFDSPTLKSVDVFAEVARADGSTGWCLGCRFIFRSR